MNFRSALFFSFGLLNFPQSVLRRDSRWGGVDWPPSHHSFWHAISHSCPKQRWKNKRINVVPLRGIHAKSRENMGWRAIDGCSGTVQEGKKKKE
mmetsp:Transcript_29784/g.30289  ORF Transcript_29784/g.30289 Transcript_29784/m.30289 type:complete len:94 (+) Transcript_29784:248-529(+)